MVYLLKLPHAILILTQINQGKKTQNYGEGLPSVDGFPNQHVGTPERQRQQEGGNDRQKGIQTCTNKKATLLYKKPHKNTRGPSSPFPRDSSLGTLDLCWTAAARCGSDHRWWRSKSRPHSGHCSASPGMFYCLAAVNRRGQESRS